MSVQQAWAIGPALGPAVLGVSVGRRPLGCGQALGSGARLCVCGRYSPLEKCFLTPEHGEQPGLAALCPGGAHRQGCWVLAASWDTMSPASSMEGAISSRPAVLAALFACPGSHDIVSHSAASYFSRGSSPLGTTSVQLLTPAVHALLPRKQV